MRGQYDDDDDDDFYEDDRSRRKWLAGAVTVAVVGLAVGGFLYLRADNGDRTVQPSAGPTTPTTEASSADSTATTDITTPETTDPPVENAPSTAITRPAASTSSTAQVAQSPPVSSTSPATTTPSQRPTSNGPVPTLPDGSPVPIVVVFDIDTITITGEVPSDASATRLEALALGNSKTPAVVASNLIINPKVPITVGVRVIEVNSVRFPESSAVVKPQHAAELDRVANVMKVLPNISVLVIGHADQRGTEQANFAISDARARAVVNYLISTGVSADRLSSRAVGATDLLSINDDATALALNRRTEFIFYGLLIE